MVFDQRLKTDTVIQVIIDHVHTTPETIEVLNSKTSKLRLQLVNSAPNKQNENMLDLISGVEKKQVV
eukprot:CAMPEP_0116933404 /NCGR_PEP_ID=MMETSP0467-20121206/29021_1 /TAXON_ID=283647 /ORGANISM="Mesodinium pulex, Strain SPMC105" /LENGTH=66 /DNA_ID=CAMNT_0004614287 /DNA_START=311 /DNA_END=511 /DNA_ORIENTATION=+